MAVMYNMAQDWTYDQFVEDAEAYKATAQKGVHCRSNASYREYFMVFIKNMVRDFTEEWNKRNNGRMYSNNEGWIGDAFARKISNDYGFFSDFYKDAYGQRPHLDIWYYVHALGLPMLSDTARMFCADPVGRAIADARRCREAE